MKFDTGIGRAGIGRAVEATVWRYRIPYVKHFLRTRGPRNSLMKFDNLMKFDSLMKFDILSKVPAQQAPETA